MLHPVGILAVATVRRPSGRLDIGSAPRLGPEHAKKGGGMKGAGSDLEVIGLMNDTAF